MKRIISILFIAFSLIIANGNLEVQAQPTISNNGMFYRSFAQNGLLNGLISLWGFDETSGTTAFDSHGSNDGTNNGATVNQTGILDKSYLFNGSSNYIAIPALDDLLSSNSEISISAWVKTSSTSAQSILGVFNTGTTTGISASLNYAINSSSGKMRLFVRDDDGVYVWAYTTSSYSQIYNGNWHNIILTRSGLTIEIYLDGTSLPLTYEPSSGNPSNFSSFGYDLYLGSGNNRGVIYQPLSGTLDQTAIWNRVLTATEAGVVASIIPYNEFTVQIEQRIKTIYNRFYENISDVEIPLRIAS